VGGGFAGLSAAYHLKLGGAQVSVLEAGDRVGGRVWTLDSFARGRLIEAGGELIGMDHKVWLELALQFKLGLSVITDEDHFAGQWLDTPVELGNSRLKYGQIKSLYERMEPSLRSLSKYAVAHVRDAHKPWGMNEAERKRMRALDEKSMADWIGNHVPRGRCREALELEFENTNGAEVRDQGLLFNLAMIKGGGGVDYWDQVEVYRCEDGNQALAESLREAIGNARVRLSTSVTGINIRPEGVEVVTNSAGGEAYEYVVLAIPPTKLGALRVSPDINWKDYEISTGKVVKYLSRVRERFWVDGRSAPSSTSSEYGVTWEGTDNQMRRKGDEIVLNLFAGGRAAERALAVPRSQKDEEDHYKAQFKGVYPSYDQNLVEGRLVRWPEDRNVLCGYSCPKPGQVTEQGRNLSRPFHERMYFAGEHTCPAFYGYMEGALHSGKRVAQEILGHDRKKMRQPR
jgi:monoamine oxidase